MCFERRIAVCRREWEGSGGTAHERADVFFFGLLLGVAKAEFGEEVAVVC